MEGEGGRPAAVPRSDGGGSVTELDEAAHLRKLLQEAVAAAKRARAEEREACARLVETMPDFDGYQATRSGLVDQEVAAAAIRARGKTT